MTDIERELRRRAPNAKGAKELTQLFVERATAEGVADVVFNEVDSPFGSILVARTRRGLVRVSITGEEPGAVLEDLARRISPRVLGSQSELADVRRQLDEYFEGQRRTFDLPLDWRLVEGFNRSVLEYTAKIPYGGTSTYKEMATKAGSPRAARAAGNALHNNPIPIIVPCHRVLYSGGGLGGYGGGLDMKTALLRLEGAIL